MVENVQIRLTQIRDVLGISQGAFGERIGVTRSAVCNYENGTRNLTERVIKDICREFNVNYAWLKEGIGEMFISSDDSVANRIDDLLAGENETAKALFRAFASLDDSDWLTVQKVIDELKKN